MNENVLRETSGPRRDETKENWKRLLSEEFHDLYSTPNNIQVIKSYSEIGEACGMHGGEERFIQGFGGKA